MESNVLLKKASRTQRIIDLMQRKQGAGNDELNKIAYRYGAIIHRLRKDGHQIDTIQIKKGYFKYYMVD
jgi:hypothetical protein